MKATNRRICFRIFAIYLCKCYLTTTTQNGTERDERESESQTRQVTLVYDFLQCIYPGCKLGRLFMKIKRSLWLFFMFSVCMYVFFAFLFRSVFVCVCYFRICSLLLLTCNEKYFWWWWKQRRSSCNAHYVDAGYYNIVYVMYTVIKVYFWPFWLW